MVERKTVLKGKNFEMAVFIKKKEKQQIDEQTAKNLATYAFLSKYPEESFT